MRGFVLFVCAIMLLRLAGGEDEDEEEQEELDVEDEELLECFRCDLGFWNTCYTTTVKCSTGEKCYTGQGKAADVLDLKTLGCVKVEECNVETTVELFPNTTFYAMTKHCCDAPFCNAAHKPPLNACLCLTAPVLSLWWYFTGASTGLH